jgi:hypothetical protein
LWRLPDPDGAVFQIDETALAAAQNLRPADTRKLSCGSRFILS